MTLLQLRQAYEAAELELDECRMIERQAKEATERARRKWIAADQAYTTAQVNSDAE